MADPIAPPPPPTPKPVTGVGSTTVPPIVNPIVTTGLFNVGPNGADPTKGKVAAVLGYVGPLLGGFTQTTAPPMTCAVFGQGSQNCPGLVGTNGALTVTDSDASGDGIFGFGPINGVHGTASSGTGVGGDSTSGSGVFGKTATGIGVHGQSTGSGIAGQFDGNVTISGATTHGGDVTIKGKVAVTGDQTVDGSISVTKDILLTNGDCAEEFDLRSAADIDPGTVLSLDDDGALMPSSTAYDSRVVGVVSGGGKFRPAIVLDRQLGDGPRVAVALLGKVFCKVDAEYEPVAVGDLLTTAATPGYAMKASDKNRSLGAVIGKALAPLNRGRNLIPILVTLR
jgi:hypothetical protein